MAPQAPGVDNLSAPRVGQPEAPGAYMQYRRDRRRFVPNDEVLAKLAAARNKPPAC